MSSELSAELCGYLKYCGLSQRMMARCRSDTRMYHDLGLYGEIAEGYMDALAENYHADMSGFEFERFFPPEFEGDDSLISALLSIVPLAGYLARRRREYEPLTLATIESVLRSKHWPEL